MMWLDKKEVKIFSVGFALIALFGALLIWVANSKNSELLEKINQRIASYEILPAEEAKQLTLDKMNKEREVYLRNKLW